jgi:hypothetical protein
MNILNKESAPRLTVIQGGKTEGQTVDLPAPFLTTIETAQPEAGTSNCVNGVCTLDWKPRRPTAA